MSPATLDFDMLHPSTMRAGGTRGHPNGARPDLERTPLWRVTNDDDEQASVPSDFPFSFLSSRFINYDRYILKSFNVSPPPIFWSFDGS